MQNIKDPLKIEYWISGRNIKGRMRFVQGRKALKPWAERSGWDERGLRPKRCGAGRSRLHLRPPEGAAAQPRRNRIWIREPAIEFWKGNAGCKRGEQEEWCRTLLQTNFRALVPRIFKICIWEAKKLWSKKEHTTKRWADVDFKPNNQTNKALRCHPFASDCIQCIPKPLFGALVWTRA